MTPLRRPRPFLVALAAVLLLALAAPSAGAGAPRTIPYRVGGAITLDTDLRSVSGASAWAIDQFLASTTSLPPLGAAFIEAESTYGVNARFLLAAAMHESGWGNSYIARVKHNLFGYNAFDRDPGRYASAYRTFEANIEATAKFIRDFYLTPGGHWWAGAPTLRAMQQHWSSSHQWGVSVSRLANSIVLPSFRGRTLDFATPAVGDQLYAGDDATVQLSWSGGAVPAGVDFVATWTPVELDVDAAQGPTAVQAADVVQAAAPAAIASPSGVVMAPQTPAEATSAAALPDLAASRPAVSVAASRQGASARAVTLSVPTPAASGTYTLSVDMRDAGGSPLPAAQRVAIPSTEVRVLSSLAVTVSISPTPDGNGATIGLTNTGRDTIPASADPAGPGADAPGAAPPFLEPAAQTIVSVAAVSSPVVEGPVPLLSEALASDLPPGASVEFAVSGVTQLTGRTANWVSVNVCVLGNPSLLESYTPAGVWLNGASSAATAGMTTPSTAWYAAPPTATAAPLAAAPVLMPAAPAQPTPTTAPAATPAPTAAPAHVTRTLSENSSAVAYRGRWGSASGDYIGGRVAYATAVGATAVLTFTGTSVSWLGPVGPTRGAADVLLDGVVVAHVNLWRSTFAARNVLFSQTFKTAGRHTLTIKVLPAPGHPYVAIDGFIVRT